MTFILFTLRILFKCPFGFGLSFENNLLHVWYIISIFFLSSFMLVCCLLGVEIPVGLWNPSLFFVGCIFIYLKTRPFSSTLLVVLHVYSLCWLFIALTIYGVLKNFCKATDVVARILRIRFFLLGPLALQS